MLGFMDDNERALLTSTILHFVTALNAERQRAAELTRRLEVAEERLRLLDAVHYGLA